MFFHPLYLSTLSEKYIYIYLCSIIYIYFSLSLDSPSVSSWNNRLPPSLTPQSCERSPFPVINQPASVSPPQLNVSLPSMTSLCSSLNSTTLSSPQETSYHESKYFLCSGGTSTYVQPAI